MKQKLGIFILLSIIGIVIASAQQPEYQNMKREAERYFEEGSYAKAYEIYSSIDSSKLAKEEAEWVKFRSADTLWRSQASTQTADTTKFDSAKQQLESFVRDISREEDRNLVWVETQESLGDFYWLRNDQRNWHQGWQYYQQALEWWAGSDDLENARKRYLNIVWKITRPSWVEPYYHYGYYGNWLPLSVLQNAVKIARSEDEKAHAHYLIAMTLRHQGGHLQPKRVAQEFEAALKSGKSSDWYDDALYQYSEWMMQSGGAIRDASGQWRQQPDFVKALQLLRRLLQEHTKGETRYYDQAKQRIDEITKPAVSVSVSNIFIPDAEVQYHLQWRNTKQIQFALYQVDLTRDVSFSKNSGAGNYIHHIRIEGRQPVRSWRKETGDPGDYKPSSETLKIEGKLGPGAYLLQATIPNGTSARDLVLVTDASIVLKTSPAKALIYFCSAFNGTPLANARVHVWQRYYQGEYLWREVATATDENGLAIVQLQRSSANIELFVSASTGQRQAFSTGHNYSNQRAESEWRIYAFTDRPAYRPKEQTQWKFVARRYDGSTYSTPANESIEYELYDPRGSKVKTETIKLNAFGSAWGTVDLTEEMPLGEYRVTFYDSGRRHTIGNAALFRIEEYKLPEFKVSLQTPEEDGKKKRFRLGDSVEVNIRAEYYFGGAVSNANVEVLVYQNPFFQWWEPQREYPWYYEDTRPQYWHGGGQVIKQETLKTDASGTATIVFETLAGAAQDFEYRIEARVVDSSRREVVSAESVRVTRQSYSVYPRPEHYLYRPQDKITTNIKAIDANDQPVTVEGTVRVTRDYWFEVWIDPNGREVKGQELQEIRDRTGIFPPYQAQGEQPWKLKFRGYQHDDVLTRIVKTDADGTADFSFTPEREGYYRIRWDSVDDDSPVIAETTVWVATNATTELGYRHGGVQLILDKDTFRTGQNATVLISVPANDQYVLFAVEAENLEDYQLIHVTGTAKLVEIPITEKHVPNVFLSGVLVHDRQIFIDTKQVVVPPAQHFLQVDVKPDRTQYHPRDEGTLIVTARDVHGKPVSAEIGLGLVDESVFYIQQDYAGDPRQFYYGNKRPLLTQTTSTFQMKSYSRPDSVSDAIKDGRERDSDHEYLDKIPSGRDPWGAVAETPGVSNDRIALNQAAPEEAISSLGYVAAAEPRAAKESALFSDHSIAGGKMAATGQPNVIVRSDFRATVLWKPDAVTGQNGTATVKVKYPDSLTSWKATARVITAANQFGIASSVTRTRQPLIVRLQAPRFFVAGDTVTISANVNNNTDSPMNVSASLEAEGITTAATTAHLLIPANGEKRADWKIAARFAGTARLKVTAVAAGYADSMEKTYPIYEHGLEKLIAKSGKARADDISVILEIPAQRKKETTELVVQITPSIAVTMLDALPYLIDYPYGCTEQTMSRFLPAAIVAKTLKDLGLQPSQIEGKLFGGIEPQSASKTHPDGKKDLTKLNTMVREGLKRLYDFQHSDGGWGWWKEGESDHFMSAYVVWGLTIAKKAGLEIRDDALNRGADYLEKELVEEEEAFDMQAWMLHALSAHHSAMTAFDQKAVANLWKNRDRLNAYTRALFALSANAFGQKEQAAILIRNLENGVKMDTTPDTSLVMRGQQQSSETVMPTAHWGEDGIWWRWSDGGVEATSFVLRALLAIDPQNKLIEPVMNWLLKNRRGAQWSNTRDTAIAVFAFTDYLRSSGELNDDSAFELHVNGSSIASHRVSLKDILGAPSLFSIDRKHIKDGANEIRIRRKTGKGNLYFAAYAKFFSLEEPLTATGNEIFVRRQYFKYTPKQTLLKGHVYERRPLNDGEKVKSGERVEVVVTVEAKNNYEYLVFEDLKPGGLEAVQIRSGESLYARELKSGSVARRLQNPPGRIEQADYTDRNQWVYQELRDRKVALFIDKLPEGVWEIRYDLRAEVPGNFHALPLLGHAMYVPEIRANDNETRISIED